MRTHNPYPRPINDPEADGIPTHADDDSTAFDDLDLDSPRVADGATSMALPPDREDGPEAMDDFGTTAEEQLRGEPHDMRLTREEPDLTPDDVWVDSDPRLADEATTEDATAQVRTDADIMDEGPIDPDLGSTVSSYERVGEDPQTAGLVGRLVEPDRGSGIDAERDSIARDEGAAGGGASAEELAMHEVQLEELERE
jgi:hypothetical protein